MPTPVIDPVRLPLDIESGAAMGPSFSTSVITLSGGAEQRNANWQQEKFKANIAYGVMSRDNPQDQEDGWFRVIAFFRARRGRARGFLFRDWTDYQAVAEPLYVTPDNNYKTWQLSKTYGSYVRKITRPNVQTIQLMYKGQEIPVAGGSVQGYTFPAWVTTGGGIITFASAIDATVMWELTATYEFDIPVRFDVDEISLSLIWAQAGSIPSIDIVQVSE